MPAVIGALLRPTGVAAVGLAALATGLSQLILVPFDQVVAATYGNALPCGAVIYVSVDCLNYVSGTIASKHGDQLSIATSSDTYELTLLHPGLSPAIGAVGSPVRLEVQQPQGVVTAFATGQNKYLTTSNPEGIRNLNLVSGVILTALALALFATALKMRGSEKLSSAQVPKTWAACVAVLVCLWFIHWSMASYAQTLSPPPPVTNQPDTG